MSFGSKSVIPPPHTPSPASLTSLLTLRAGWELHQKGEMRDCAQGSTLAIHFQLLGEEDRTWWKWLLGVSVRWCWEQGWMMRQLIAEVKTGKKVEEWRETGEKKEREHTHKLSKERGSDLPLCYKRSWWVICGHKQRWLVFHDCMNAPLWWFSLFLC